MAEEKLLTLIQLVPTFKYLGINLDQTLNFKYHLDSLINIISFKLYMFSKVRRFLNKKCAIIVYKTMLMPFYDYYDIVYLFFGAYELHKLDRHHIRGMNKVNKNRKFIEEELYVKCSVSKLEVHLRNVMFKNKNKCIVKENNINTRPHDGPVFQSYSKLLIQTENL